MDGPKESWTKGEFLAWCRDAGLEWQEDIAAVFSISSQTIRNWERSPGEPMPRWAYLCAVGVSAWRNGPLKDQMPMFPPPGHMWFGEWAVRRGLDTYELRGRAFGHCRATVCKWYRRGLPGWLPLACLGLDALGYCRSMGKSPQTQGASATMLENLSNLA